jgi:hypothetical protein
MASADSTSPDAAVVSPAGGTVSGAVDVTASASDDVKVTSVQLFVDGVAIAGKTAAPYTFAWDTTSLPNGTHWLYVRAYDAAGNYGTGGVTTVTVANAGGADVTPPSVSITAPTYGATVSGSVAVSATATDDTAVTKVVFIVDGATVGTDTSPPYSAAWDASTVYAGSHMITATAYDAGGNTSTALVAVTRPAPADATPPTVSITAPANGATASGLVAVTATAADDKGVAKVEFSVDGTLVSTATGAPFGFSWDAGKAAAGAHTIAARAYDAAGNTSTAQITVIVAGDTAVPKTPSNLKAAVIGTTQVAFYWTASTDNVGVVAYEVFRDGVQVAETQLPNYLDTGLAPGSSHKYQVRARDAAGNRSALTSALSARLVAASTSGTGTIAGVVYDAGGKPLANVVVQVTGNGVTKSAKTGSNGSYKFSSLAPGDYVVTVAAPTGVAAAVPAGSTATPSVTVVGGVTVLVVDAA